MLQLPQRLGFDLPDALSGHRELLADFFQGVVGVHADAEAHAQHAFLAWRQRGQHAGGGLAQVGLDRGVDRQDRVLVLDEIAEMRVFLVAHWRFQRQRLFRDLENFSNLLQGHAELLGQFLRRRFAPDLIQHLARGAHDLVDGLDHVHGNADGTRLVGNASRDRLPDPPGRIGRELVAAAILEFVDRLHQPDIAFLDQIEELQAAVGVFLGDRDHQPQIGLDHLLLGAAGFALAALHGLHDAAELGDRQFGIAGDLGDRGAMAPDIAATALDQAGPAAAGQGADPLQPIAGQLVAHIGLQEFGALDAGPFGEPQHAALLGDEPAVQLVELLDEMRDAGVVEPHLAQQLDHLVLRLVVATLGGARQLGALDDRGDALVLDLVELFVDVGDGVENPHHAGLQLRFHRGQRGSSFLAVLALALGFGLFAELDDDIVARGRRAVGVADRLGRLDDRRLGLVEIGAAIGRVEIDDVAQQHLVFVQRIAPTDQRAHRQRALADAADHHLAASLDPLGDRDLALARQQLDRAHLAQVHAHGVVGAADVIVDVAAGFALAVLGFGPGLGGILALFTFDDVDAELGEHRHRVLDLLRG